MLSEPLKKLTSLLLVVIILVASTLCLCRETHATGQPETAAVSCDADADPSCPACPDKGGSDADHDAASCFCPCHLPLIVQPVRICPAPLMSRLFFFEPLTVFPEVYLPKFIPPQITA
jgi:hypothetical protein